MTTTPRPGLDQHANPMSADADTIAAYDSAVDELLRFSPRVLESMGVLTSGAPPSPMGLAFGAYMHLSSTDAADVDGARSLARALSGTAKNEREALHHQAIAAWLDGAWAGAARVLDEVLYEWPTDLLALMIGHQLDFFGGDAESLRDRPLRTLVAMDPADPHAGFVRGMSAFGLEECGNYGAALDAGLRAVDEHRDDVWSAHAVVHTYEMQGMVAEGISFLTSGRAAWERENLFSVHNSWHLGLFRLEAGQIDEVLAIYDSSVRPPDAGNVPIEMLDASALLWRLHLDGVDVGGRAASLADAWVPAAQGPSWYAFNDLHAVLAFVAAGRLDDARAVIDRLVAWLGSSPSSMPVLAGSNAEMTSLIGLPSCRAVVAYGEGRYSDVVAALHPIRRQLQRFGGSHAQRDLLQRTLLDAAIRSGQLDLARALTSERLGVRPASVYGWTQRARVMRSVGDVAGAAIADANAAGLRASFAEVGPAAH